MNGDDLILGFDARPAEPPEWDERRKRDFLFRLDVRRPLSIDTMVWPSRFDSHPDLKPPYVGPYGYWEDLGKLRERAGDAWIVAFEVIAAAASGEERAALIAFLRGVTPDGRPGEEPAAVADPPAPGPLWSSLGYDVADLGGGISGLMNVRLPPEREDMESLRARWSPKLNESHLFNEVDDARDFKDFSNRRVPEHAPFFVYRIWRVNGEPASERYE
jgi:hypothetical protein